MIFISAILDIVFPIITSFGMQYVAEEFTVIIKSLVSNYFAKALVFFCVFLSLVKNKYIALGLTLIVFALLMTLYNKDSKYSVLMDNPVSESEIFTAKQILEKAEIQKRQKTEEKIKEFEKNICNFAMIY